MKKGTILLETMCKKCPKQETLLRQKVQISDARDEGEGQWGMITQYGIFFWDDENILELVSDDVCLIV